MYKGRTFQRETIYVTGEFIDGDIYPVFQPPGKRRRKCRPTSAIQQRLNQRNAERKLERLLNNNFGETDLAIHLTYRDGELPEDEEAAKKNVQNYLRRVKRRYARLGLELKYICVTEIGEKTGRVHHHLVLSGGMDRDELERLWGKGRANADRLQIDDDGLGPLARYITKSRRSGSRITYRRWTGSRNLVRPEPLQYDGRLTQEDVRQMADEIETHSAAAKLEEQYPGYRCVRCEAERNPINRGIYIRYTMRAVRRIE